MVSVYQSLVLDNLSVELLKDSQTASKVQYVSTQILQTVRNDSLIVEFVPDNASGLHSLLGRETRFVVLFVLLGRTDVVDSELG